MSFDSEYLKEFGEWDPQQPYGYASHDVHVMARVEGRVVGHVGWAGRDIAVGTEVVSVAGVGGVLISADARGVRLGSELMEWAERSMRECDHLAFGYENAATSQPPNPDRPGSRGTSHGLCCGRVEWVVQGRRRSVDATC